MRRHVEILDSQRTHICSWILTSTDSNIQSIPISPFSTLKLKEERSSLKFLQCELFKLFKNTREDYSFWINKIKLLISIKLIIYELQSKMYMEIKCYFE